MLIFLFNDALAMPWTTKLGKDEEKHIFLLILDIPFCIDRLFFQPLARHSGMKITMNLESLAFS